MNLIYSYDPERFYLGSACKHGHLWPGTNQSLRRIYKSSGGKTVNHCLGCKGRKQSDWLISFIDNKAMGLPAGWSFGKVCKEGHRWQGYKMTIKDLFGKCPDCEKSRKAKQRKRRSLDPVWRAKQSSLSLKSSAKRLAENPDVERKRRADAARRYRAKHGRKSRAQGAGDQVLPVGIGRGTGLASGLLARGIPAEHLVHAAQEHKALWAAIRQAGRLPLVKQLVDQAQREFWAEHPKAKAAYDRERARLYSKWMHRHNPEYRLYHRQKSKRRKALERGSIGLHVKGRQVKARFAQFGHCCAYCGATEDLHIEHVVPISFGGTHVLSNIVPACKSCNFSKRDKDAESWYRQQPFFCEKRWRKILRMMGTGKGSPQQLALL
jgi:5-methylcytosine-specific restriction endonuclease McrA